MKRHLFSIDPGDKNIGFCYFTYDTETKMADTKVFEIIDPDGLSDMLKVIWGVYVAHKAKSGEAPNITIVAENFRIDSEIRKRMFQWSELLTIRRIGAIELCAKWVEAKFVTQEPVNVLPMARKWGPWKTLPKHIPDDKSAWLHGAHYMMNVKPNRWLSTIDQITWYGQEKL